MIAAIVLASVIVWLVWYTWRRSRWSTTDGSVFNPSVRSVSEYSRSGYEFIYWHVDAEYSFYVNNNRYGGQLSLRAPNQDQAYIKVRELSASKVTVRFDPRNPDKHTWSSIRVAGAAASA